MISIANASKTPFRLAVAIAAAATLSACTGSGVATRYDRVHAIEIEEAPQLLYLPAQGTLSSQELRSIDQFGRQYLVNGKGEITIAYPSTVDASEPVRMIAQELVALGIPGANVMRGPYDVAAEGRDDIVVSFNARTAVGAGCPEAWGDPTRDASNRTPLRFGCSFQQNLAAMVDRPSDLVEPRASTPADAERRQVVFENYRQGKPTGAELEIRETNTRQQTE